MTHSDTHIHATASIDHNDQEGVRVHLDLYHDDDGEFRWYERETGADTAVSGQHIAAAKASAERAWSGPWNLVID